MRRARTGCILVLLVAGSLLLSSCGTQFASETSAEISADAISAMVHSYSTTATEAYEQNGHRVSIEVSMYRTGASDGTFEVGESKGDLVVADQTVYFRGPASFWLALSALGNSALPESYALLLAHRWVGLVSSSEAEFSSLTYSGLLASIRAGAVRLAKTGTKTIDGTPAVAVGSRAEGTMWVSTRTPHHPVEIVRHTGSGAAESIRFLAWGEGSPPTVPLGAEPIDKILASGG